MHKNRGLFLPVYNTTASYFQFEFAEKAAFYQITDHFS